MNQKTIKGEVTLSGEGLHTGETVCLRLLPAEIDAGIFFVRTDIVHSPVIKITPESVNTIDVIPRCTSIRSGDVMVHTTEHLLSALSGLGITNLRIEMDGTEVPGLDGSGLGFLSAIQKVGVETQNAHIQPFVITEPITVAEGNSSIHIFPAKDFEVSYVLDYDHPFLGSQFYSVNLTEASYANEIAPSRTFCLESEAVALQAQGLGKGANHTNTLVVGEHGVLDNETHFPDEFARHKILDIIGDLYLLGAPVQGHILAKKSGHRLNMKLLRKIYESCRALERREPTFSLKDGQRVFDVQDIMKILPHRYPFLFVDRVVEIEKGKKALGIKNVTINDNFFQGHFPTRPVMPGVLMVEAMAQTGGVVVLTSEAHRGKLAFFMAVDNVKFRKVVSPGDQLLMEVEVVRDRSRTSQLKAQATVDGEIVAEADMVFSFTDQSYL